MILGFAACTLRDAGQPQKKEKTVFQTGGPWKPVTDIRADVAIVYGMGDADDMTFEQRFKAGATMDIPPIL
jgi:hypothetical protein